MDKSGRAWTDLLFLAVTAAVNAAGAMGWINGLTQREVSDKYPTLISPAPMTFMIWGLICALLFVALIVAIARSDEEWFARASESIRKPFRLSCALNVAWIFLFSYELVEVTAFVVAALAIVVCVILDRMKRAQDQVNAMAVADARGGLDDPYRHSVDGHIDQTGDRQRAEGGEKTPKPRGWGVLHPAAFGLYGGWLLIAAFTNVATALVKTRWDGFTLTAQTWAIIVMALAAALACVALARNRNAVFPLAVAWGFFGIFETHATTAYAALRAVALVGVAIMVLAAVICFLQNKVALLPAPDRAKTGYRSE